MASEAGDFDALNISLHNFEVGSPSSPQNDGVATPAADGTAATEAACRTRASRKVTLHFQIIHLSKQGNTASLLTSLEELLSSDNTSTGIAPRLVLKTGLNIILASNVPKNNPLLEATAERKLVEKLIQLGHTTPKSEGSIMQRQMQQYSQCII